MSTPTIAAEDVLPGHPDRLCDAVAEAIVEIACAPRPASAGRSRGRHPPAPARRHRPRRRRLRGRRDPSRGRRAAGPRRPGSGGRRLQRSLGARTPRRLRSRDRPARRQTNGPSEGSPTTRASPSATPTRSAPTFSRSRRPPPAVSAKPFPPPERRHPMPSGPTARCWSSSPPSRGRAWTGSTSPSSTRPGIGYEDLHRLLVPQIRDALAELAGHLDPLARLDGDTLRVNGIGDFTCGGPRGDNGLSGKKLVVDHYGPQVPIGGGALCGKDPHKPDRVGPLRARQLAVRLARTTGQAATVHLGWLPGGEEPDRLSARLGDGTILDAAPSREPSRSPISPSPGRPSTWSSPPSRGGRA